jgi:hypothetical protein
VEICISDGDECPACEIVGKGEGAAEEAEAVGELIDELSVEIKSVPMEGPELLGFLVNLRNRLAAWTDKLDDAASKLEDVKSALSDIAG